MAPLLIVVARNRDAMVASCRIVGFHDEVIGSAGNQSQGHGWPLEEGWGGRGSDPSPSSLSGVRGDVVLRRRHLY